MGGCTNDIIKQLQKAILPWQGFKSLSINANTSSRLPSFLHQALATSCMHEILSASPEDIAATNGFVTALLSRIMPPGAVYAWISSSRTLFPPALKMFQLEPDQFIFIDLKDEKDVLPAMEDALKCERFATVLGELRDISFSQSRRFQLATEQSKVTGFILRHQPRLLNTLACVSRWRITSLPSSTDHEIPGVGFPRWNIELLKLRNGKPGTWKLEWSANHFKEIRENVFLLAEEQRRKTG